MDGKGANDAQNMCSATMLCCSRRQIHHPDLRRVVSWGLGAGGYSSRNMGNLYEGKSTLRGIITSRFNMHTRLHTHIHTSTCNVTHLQIHYADVFWQLNIVDTSICIERNPISLQDHIKTCCTTNRKDSSTSPIPLRKVNASVSLNNQNNPRAARFQTFLQPKATSDLQQNYSKFKARTG